MGIVHKEWVPAGQTVNQYYYTEILERLRKRVMWVCLKIAKNQILHRDNVPAHAALSVAQFLTSKCITVMLQSPYSPNFTPSDLILFQKVKLAVKEHNCESTEDIRQVITQAFNDILQGAV